MSFFGTQPAFTHVPPVCAASNTATLSPAAAARRAAAIPPEPAPMMARSYLVCSNLGVMGALFLLRWRLNLVRKTAGEWWGPTAVFR